MKQKVFYKRSLDFANTKFILSGKITEALYKRELLKLSTVKDCIFLNVADDWYFSKTHFNYWNKIIMQLDVQQCQNAIKVLDTSSQFS